MDIPTKSNGIQRWSNIDPQPFPHIDPGSWRLPQNRRCSGAEVYSWLKSCLYHSGFGLAAAGRHNLKGFFTKNGGLTAETLEMGLSENGVHQMANRWSIQLGQLWVVRQKNGRLSDKAIWVCYVLDLGLSFQMTGKKKWCFVAIFPIMIIMIHRENCKFSREL